MRDSENYSNTLSVYHSKSEVLRILELTSEEEYYEQVSSSSYL